MVCRQVRSNNHWVIYDEEILGTGGEQLFDAEAPVDFGMLERGRALMFSYRGLELVLKRYHRGGLVGRLVKKSYLRGKLEDTRMWREFEMLGQMREMALPVPRPVAARCVRETPLTYSGELITEKIVDSQTLADILSERSLPAEIWGKLGQIIARFHRQNIYHADLNANNILLTRAGEIYLIDFDKREIRSELSARQAEANVQRLRRSLLKLSGHFPEFHFSESNWESLVASYAQG